MHFISYTFANTPSLNSASSTPEAHSVSHICIYFNHLQIRSLHEQHIFKYFPISSTQSHGNSTFVHIFPSKQESQTYHHFQAPTLVNTRPSITHTPLGKYTYSPLKFYPPNHELTIFFILSPSQESSDQCFFPSIYTRALTLSPPHLLLVIKQHNSIFYILNTTLTYAFRHKIEEVRNAKM